MLWQSTFFCGGGRYNVIPTNGEKSEFVLMNPRAIVGNKCLQWRYGHAGSPWLPFCVSLSLCFLLCYYFIIILIIRVLSPGGRIYG